MYNPSLINNLAEATCNQFLALNPCNRLMNGSIEDAIAISEQQLAFLKNCKIAQDVAKEKLGKLKEYKINSQSIVEKLNNFSKIAESSLSPSGQVVVEGKYLVLCTRLPFAIETCGLCGHHNNTSYEFTVTNLSQQGLNNTIKFKKLNIHAIVAHKNFSYPGPIGSLEGYEISVFDALKIFELIK